MVHRAIMAFRPVSPSVKFPELDEELLAFWERVQIFEKTLAARPGEDTREPFVFRMSLTFMASASRRLRLPRRSPSRERSFYRNLRDFATEPQ